MYYYYYYYYPESIKVNVEIALKDIYDDNISLEQLNDFLKAINEIHQRIIFVTQPEYKKARGNLGLINQASLLSYNMINVDSFLNENGKSILKISFSLFTNSANLYWLIWKILIDICKRYGKDKEALEKNFNKIINEAQEFIKLNFNTEYNEKVTAKIENIDEFIKGLLTNPTFIKWYNLLCTTSIEITKLIARVELIENIELILIEKEE